MLDNAVFSGPFYAKRCESLRRLLIHRLQVRFLSGVLLQIDSGPKRVPDQLNNAHTFSPRRPDPDQQARRYLERRNASRFTPLTGDLSFHQIARPHLDHFQLSGHLPAELIQGELNSLAFI
jgi:hypothetical protein